MYFLCRDDTETYITIHREDEQNFYDIVNSDVLGQVCKFRLIKDKSEIKQILEDKYSSKNRTAEYSSGLPSATLISSALFPYNLDHRSQDNKINLLRWHNNITVSDLQTQKVKNKLSTDSGTFIHEILELAIKDRNARLFEKKHSLSKYIELVCEDENIQNMIDNFQDRKVYFVEMAEKTLSKFFNNELCNIDPVFNEIFLRNKGIQGAIDLVNYKGKDLYVSDFKTSKKSCSRNEIPNKGYLRQLYIYSRMLLKDRIISQKEYDNLKFEIYFFNWNSCNSYIYNYSKEEVDKSKGYVRFILEWYYRMKDMDIDLDDVI